MLYFNIFIKLVIITVDSICLSSTNYKNKNKKNKHSNTVNNHNLDSLTFSNSQIFEQKYFQKQFAITIDSPYNIAVNGGGGGGTAAIAANSSSAETPLQQLHHTHQQHPAAPIPGDEFTLQFTTGSTSVSPDQTQPQTAQQQHQRMLLHQQQQPITFLPQHPSQFYQQQHQQIMRGVSEMRG